MIITSEGKWRGDRGDEVMIKTAGMDGEILGFLTN